MAGRSSEVASTTSGMTGEWEQEKNCVVCNARLVKSGLGGTKRYGCKFCMHAVCAKCSPNRELHPDTGKAERICNTCYKSKDTQDQKNQMAEIMAQASSEIARLETQLQEAVQSKQNEEVLRVRKETEVEELKGKIFALSCELSEKMTENPMQMQENERMRKEIEELKGENSKLKEKNEYLEQANETFKTEIDQKKTELISILTELKENKGKLMDQKELQVELQTLQDSLRSAKDQVSALQSAKSALESDNAEYRNRLSETQIELKSLQTRIIELENKHFSLEKLKNSELAEAEKTQKDLEKELNSALNRSVEAEKQLKEWENARIQSEQDRIQQEKLVTSKIEALQKMISDFTVTAEEQKKISDLKEKSIEILQKEVKELTKKLENEGNEREKAIEMELMQQNNLKNQLKSIEEQLNRTEISKNELLQTYNRTLDDLKRSEMHQNDLQKDLLSLQNQLKSLENELKMSQNAIEDWREKHSKSQQEAAILAEKLTAANLAVENAQKLVQTEKTRYKSEENERKKTYLEEITGVRKEMEVQIRTLTAENQVLKEKNSDLMRLIDDLKDEKAEKTKKELELSACQERLRTLEEVQITLERRHPSSLSSHKSEIETLTSQLDQFRDEKMRLNMELAQNNMKIGRMEEKLKEVSGEKERVLGEFEALKSALNRGENEQIRTLMRENKDVNNALKAVTEQKFALESELQALQSTHKSLQSDLEKTHSSVQILHSDLEKHKSLYLQKDQENGKLTQELMTVKEHCGRLNTVIAELKQNIEEKEAEYVLKTRKISEGGTAEISRLEEQVGSYRLESVKLEEELHKVKLDLARKMHDLEVRNAEVNSQLLTAKGTIAGLQKDILQEKANYERDKATALELIDSLNARLKDKSGEIVSLEREKSRLQGMIDSVQVHNEELKEHLTQERVGALKKEKELQQRNRKSREVVEDVEDLADLERRTEEQQAAVKRLTAARGVTKTMGERELEEQGFGRKRKGSDPGARDACRCHLF